MRRERRKKEREAAERAAEKLRVKQLTGGGKKVGEGAGSATKPKRGRNRGPQAAPSKRKPKGKPKPRSRPKPKPKARARRPSVDPAEEGLFSDGADTASDSDVPLKQQRRGIKRPQPGAEVSPSSGTVPVPAPSVEGGQRVQKKQKKATKKKQKAKQRQRSGAGTIVSKWCVVLRLLFLTFAPPQPTPTPFTAGLLHHFCSSRGCQLQHP